VYGLGANALNEEAVRRIYVIKGRPATSPLIVHVSSIEMAQSLTIEWSEMAARLAAGYWPGPLTLVLPKQPHVPELVTAGLPTVGIRMPAHPQALELIREAGVPVAAPSANRFTQLSPTTAAHVIEAFEGRVPVLDGGPCTVGIESTVLSLAGASPVLLRPGMIPPEELEAITGPLHAISEQTGAHSSPGLHERHYQPRTMLYVGSGPDAGRGLVLRRGFELPADAAGFAAHLYEALLGKPECKRQPVESIMQPAFPFVDVSTPVDLLQKMITPQNPAVLVRDFKTDKTFIITRSDLIRVLC
jgi:L-threonylcarbamoyladenylate synthase